MYEGATDAVELGTEEGEKESGINITGNDVYSGTAQRAKGSE